MTPAFVDEQVHIGRGLRRGLRLPVIGDIQDDRDDPLHVEGHNRVEAGVPASCRSVDTFCPAADQLSGQELA